MKKLAVAVIMCLVYFTMFSHTSGIVKRERPVCGEHFTAEVDTSGSSFGRRLDLKPLGFIATPWRRPVCPKCGFVMYKEKFSQDETNKIKKLVKSKSYKNLVKENHPSYYLLAKIFSVLGKDDFTIAYTYIQASWQVEEKSPKQYHLYLQDALVFLQKFISQKNDNNKNIEAAQLLIGELQRQLSKFAEAKKHFISLANLPKYKKQPYRSIIAYELRIIKSKIFEPKIVPKIEWTLEDNMELPEYKICYGLKGIENVEKLFDISKVYPIARYGTAGHSFSIHLKLYSANKVLLDSARWYNLVDDKSKKAQNDWNDFLRIYHKASTVAVEHKWLSVWKKINKDRTIELWVIGEKPYAFDYVCTKHLLSAWTHAGLKGKPEYKIVLRRDGYACGTIYFSQHEPRAFITQLNPTDHLVFDDAEKKALLKSFHPGDGVYWLDKQLFSYHNTQDVPEYIVVDKNGKWLRNTKEK